jgi:two-component system, NtrC family, response regulator GlrR
VDTKDLEPAAARSRPRLAWTDAAGAHTLDLHEARTAGSAPTSEVVIADRAVSRLHVGFTPREDGLWVKDLASRNGTFVAGVKILEARVPTATTVRIGTTDINVTYGTPEPPETLYPEAFLGSLLGRTAAMREVFAAVARLAPTDASILLTGEGGTGKAALARAVHDLSSRRGAPFVVVDCSALPDPLAAAEVLEEALSQAEGGTLLLDEPAELSIALQRELVPPIEAKAFRAIATSTRDLRPLVNQGAFREGLYFRLAGASIHVPSLRERVADLPLLFRSFLGARQDLATSALLDDLARLPWPGNVRELKLYAERIRESGGQLSLVPEPPDPDSEAIPTFDRTMEAPMIDLSGLGPGDELVARLPPGLEPWFETPFKEFRENWIDLGEREYLRRLMKRTNRSSSAASREAGLERTYLYRLIKKHGV